MPTTPESVSPPDPEVNRLKRDIGIGALIGAGVYVAGFHEPGYTLEATWPVAILLPNTGAVVAGISHALLHRLNK